PDRGDQTLANLPRRFRPRRHDRAAMAPDRQCGSAAPSRSRRRATVGPSSGTVGGGGVRLPSFNDFSPGIIGDVRQPLLTLQRLAPDFSAVVSAWANDYFKGADNKRASTNIPATLTSLGL